MPYFGEEWIQELLNKVNIADLINEYVPLTNKSGRWWACCPFHNEKTASFSVNPEKGFFHCFGCGKSGNAIHFVMEMDKLSFPEACTHLAERVKLPVPEKTNNAEYEKRRALRQKIHQMNRTVARYYYDCLFSEEGKKVQDYLLQRGLNKNVIHAFGIGFAPDRWDSVLNLLEKEGYTRQDMQLAGLIKINEGKCYDMFRNRVMIPIIDTFSNVIGFGGRVLDDSLPKYLNSPETAAFNKSRNLFNLNNIRKLKGIKHLILVEGYMDVIALYAHGIRECVATLGTALTVEQAKIVRRYTKQVYISYDGDGAGKKAALRAVDILTKEGIEPRVLTIPDGHDPDDFLRLHKKDGYMKLVKNAQPVLDYKFGRAAEGYDLPDEMEKYAQECIGLLKKEQSAVVREKYAEKLAKLTGFSVQSIMQDIGGQEEKSQAFVPAVKHEEPAPPDLKDENRLMAVLCADPQKAELVSQRISVNDLYDETNKTIFSHILKCTKKGILPSSAEVLSVLNKTEDLKKAAQLFEEAENFPDMGGDHAYLSGIMSRIVLRNKERLKKELFAALSRVTDENTRAEVAEEIREVTLQIHELKQAIKTI
ncbi:MAG: DNA primase [Christensenellaceae bacterium]|jgi:DNA primase